MAYLDRENVITGVCVVAAILAFYGLGEYTEVGDLIRWAVLIGVGVILPLAVTNYLESAETA